MTFVVGVGSKVLFLVTGRDIYKGDKRQVLLPGEKKKSLGLFIHFIQSNEFIVPPERLGTCADPDRWASLQQGGHSGHFSATSRINRLARTASRLAVDRSFYTKLERPS